MSVCDTGGLRTISLKRIFGRNQIGMRLSVKRKMELNIGSIETSSKIHNIEFGPHFIKIWQKKFLRLKISACNQIISQSCGGWFKTVSPWELLFVHAVWAFV